MSLTWEEEGDVRGPAAAPPYDGGCTLAQVRASALGELFYLGQ